MIKKILISILLVLLLGLGTRLIIVSLQKKKEIDFHNGLPKTIQLVSEDFVEGSMIPVECTGVGKNLSPSLYWSNLPQGTRSLVLLMTDYDGPAPFLKLKIIDHWVVYNIPPSFGGKAKGITTAQLQKDSLEFGENFTKGIDYAGPKPPIGVHRYYFRIYALSTPGLVLSKPKKEELMEAMKGKMLAYGELMGRF